MFAARYFNPRYWARRYWPKVGGSSTAESAPVFAGRANDFRATRVKDFGAGRVNDYRAVRIRP
jgi:hypothetical protein